MTTQERLDEAEAQYHAFNTGQMARVFVDQNGERVEFSATNISRLRAYIIELKTELGIAVKKSQALKVYF
ncbi:MAG: gpW family head-tail joining protein [Thiomicrorhabdus sp.]|jgi:hypothetical protein|nr:gpW family head-tail joining protein [Thiomicrorhabdus sp.]